MHTWVDNELIDAGDMNYIGTRLVHRYATEDERDGVIDSPVSGQTVYVHSLRALTAWIDGGWRRLIPVPPGGTSGQVLAKASDNSFDLVWITP